MHCWKLLRALRGRMHFYPPPPQDWNKSPYPTTDIEKHRFGQKFATENRIQVKEISTLRFYGWYFGIIPCKVYLIHQMMPIYVCNEVRIVVYRGGMGLEYKLPTIKKSNEHQTVCYSKPIWYKLQIRTSVHHKEVPCCLLCYQIPERFLYSLYFIPWWSYRNKCFLIPRISVVSSAVFFVFQRFYYDLNGKTIKFSTNMNGKIVSEMGPSYMDITNRYIKCFRIFKCQTVARRKIMTSIREKKHC